MDARSSDGKKFDKTKCVNFVQSFCRAYQKKCDGNCFRHAIFLALSQNDGGKAMNDLMNLVANSAAVKKE
jgi:hypothetical protein